MDRFFSLSRFGLNVSFIAALFWAAVAACPPASAQTLSPDPDDAEAEQAALEELEGLRLDLNRALGIVVGNEGAGLRRLVRDKCDLLLRLPMRGQVQSLNAAIAGSIALYAAWQARGYVGSSQESKVKPPGDSDR